MKTDKIDDRIKKKITLFGYEYTLVKVDREKDIFNASFMGNVGFALQSFKKLNK